MTRIALLVLCACSTHETVVAKLDEIVKSVDRSPAETASWKSAKVGDTFVLGSAVRTGTASHAKLTVGKNGKLDVDANAIVRFTKHAGRKQSDVYVETGNVEVEAGDEAIGLVGEVVLEPNAHARLARQNGQLTINVTVGNVVLEDEGGPVKVAAGSTITAKDGTKPIVAKNAARSGAVTVKVTGKDVRSGDVSLPPGEHHLDAGAQLQVPEGSTVEISRDGARVVTSGPSALRTGGSPGALATASSGTIELYATTSDATADVPGGSITARSGQEAGPPGSMTRGQNGGSQSSAKLGPTGTHVAAEQGETLIRTATGQETLGAGDSAVLATDGTIEMSTSKAPTRTKLTIVAGESATLHDPKAPTPVRIELGSSCHGGGIVELAKDRSFKKVVARSRGNEAANVAVPAGAWAYRVRCDTGKGASGRLRVLRDSGRAPLPKVAARTTVEADGREYTILYENLLPELELAWRNAPATGRYVFVLQPTTGKPKRLDGTGPRLKLTSGEVVEGSYKFWVENQATRQRSEQAQIVIEFNNQAASVQIESVEIKDGKVRIRGSVIEGSTVMIGGQPVELDRHRRFTAEVAPRPGEDGVGIRIVHSKLGIHYYVLSTGPT